MYLDVWTIYTYYYNLTLWEVKKGNFSGYNFDGQHAPKYYIAAIGGVL